MNPLKLLLVGLPLFAQVIPQSPRPPRVTSGSLLLYPPVAWAAGVSGLVEVEVNTDGSKVISVKAEGAPPVLLRRAALEFIQSWQFAPHSPIRFKASIRFTLTPVTCATRDDSNYGEVFLRLPLFAEVTAQRQIECDPVEQVGVSPNE